VHWEFPAVEQVSGEVQFCTAVHWLQVVETEADAQ
jgi:hypothetical protein